jgi:integrase/recombinase XerC
LVISFFMPQSFQYYINDFLNYLQYQKRYSLHTVVSYKTDLSAFHTFIENEYGTTPIAEIKPTLIRTWLASLKEQDNNSKTINRKISTLKSFFKYQVKKDVLQQTPMQVISSPKNAKRLPQFVAKKDMETLFAHVEFPDNWVGATERLILQIFYNAGIRQAELINLQKHHIDIHNSCIKVLGKGSKERVIPISKELQSAIRSYMLLRARQFPAIEESCLLLNNKGKKLYPRYVYDIVKKYLTLVTTIDKRSPHILRHSFATHLTNNGAEINAIKELMGHSSLAATQIYTHNSIEKLKDAFNKAHPKA